MTSIIIHKQCQINDEWVKVYCLIHEFGMISNGWGVINIVWYLPKYSADFRTNF